MTTDSEAEFFITLHGAGDGELKVYGEAPYGHFPVDLLQSPNEKDTYIVRYTPQGVGLHKIHINFAGEPVQGSPYIVKVRNMTWHLPLLPNLLPNCKRHPPPSPPASTCQGHFENNANYKKIYLKKREDYELKMNILIYCDVI